ncbi:MBL fold metallo-hydrolase [Psychrobacillus phage Spoks]|nr:MBL fold metallo-hydrolase [Psychrobacillus phage Spoks]
MKVDILASGSSGNCIAITSGEKTILIDAGIAKTKIEKALLNVGIRPDNVKAIFITHAHGDHIKGIPIANKYNIPVFASAGEWKSIKGVESEFLRSVEAYDAFQFNEFGIIPFKTHHDSYEPLGYAIELIDTGYKVSVCLDSGKVDEEMVKAMDGSDIYVIESNHEPRMVEASNYPNSVKARIVSHIGHLSNQQTAVTLAKLVRGNGEKIYLVHLSSHNNMPALAKMTTKRELLKTGYVEGEHYELEVI